ncbi:MAG: hypothetical protein ACAH88_14500 [Roseimicrobium sp.]
MKAVSLLALLFLMTVFATAADKKNVDADISHSPYEALTSTTTFAIGGVGVAGIISPMEKDFRALLKEPDAVAQCQKLLTDATPEGQMYGLLGLKLKDETAFVAALSKYKESKQQVRQQSGCIMHNSSMGELAASIEKGSYK